jgi:hypothetical protein
MSDPLSHGAGGDAAETVSAGPTGDGVAGTVGGTVGVPVGGTADSAAGGAADSAADEAADALDDAAAVVDEAADGMVHAVADGAAALTIRGRVRDSLGVALPRALVTLTGPDGGRRLAKTRSGEDGAFSLAAPSQGEYLLVAFSPQLGTVRVAVQLTGRPVEVEFRIDVPGTVAP